MTKSERDQSFPDSEPRDAATLMLIDRSGPKPKVLLGRRHAGHKFMPGKFVFPGGRIEPLDREMSAVSELASRRAEKAHRARRDARVPAFARAFALAAVRETAEETGLLLGVKRDRAAGDPGEIWAEFAKAKSIPISARSISSPAPSRRRGGRAVSTRASSPPTRPPSRTRSKAWSGRTPNWSNSSGCRSSEATHLDMPTITGVVLEELARPGRGRHGARPAGAVLLHGSSEQFFRELL